MNAKARGHWMTVHRVAALALLIALSSVLQRPTARGGEAEQPGDCPVIFQQRSFLDSGDFVYITGTVTGDAVAFKYNTTAISCFKGDNECLVNSMESIGRFGNTCQMSRLDLPQYYKVEQWTDQKIVATVNTRCGSSKTYVIDRQSKTAEITEFQGSCPSPIEEVMRDEKKDLEQMLKESPDLAKSPSFAKDLARVDKVLSESAAARNKIYHWTIEDPPFWAGLKKRLVKPQH
jgi:hypothetical protein